MTVVFSVASSRCVLMAADSAVQLDFGHRREYEEGQKLWWIPGIGGVSTWGARDATATHIESRLRPIWDGVAEKTVDALARAVHSWLVAEYAPHEAGFADVGCHVAGFMPDRSPALYHSFWNTPRDSQSSGIYSLQILSPASGVTRFLYNGRSDLAERAIGALLSDLQAGKDVRFSIKSVGGMAYLAHLVLRFASEITMEVSPPFHLHAMGPDGEDVFHSLGAELISVEALEDVFKPLGVPSWS